MTTYRTLKVSLMLTDEMAAALMNLAVRERRDTKQQASIMLEAAIRQELRRQAKAQS